MKKLILSVSVLFSLLVLWSACNKKEQAVSPPLPGNEALTTMVITAASASDAADVQTAQWQELDPTGATPPDTSMAVLHLKKNAVYNVTIQFLDSAENVTSEISDRANYHLICFDVASGLNLTCVQTDHDSNNPPLKVGLTDQFTTAGVSTGQLEVTLHHQPNLKNGDCAPGSIDMDCTFTVNIN